MPSLLSVARDLSAAWRQATSLSVRDHRPWPLPSRTWLMGQSWHDLLFAHWPIAAEELRRVMPPQLEPDLIEGSAWIGVTPFELRALRLRLTLPAPLASAFPELNARTYVTVGDKPGIYFLSLDAGSRLAVTAARRLYRFPYFHASAAIERGADGWVEHRSARDDRRTPPAELHVRYKATGEAFEPQRGSLAYALVERYCAYTLDHEGRILRAEIHHRPWSICPAEAKLAVNTMPEPLGIELQGEPLLHLAAPQDVVIWPHVVASG